MSNQMTLNVLLDAFYTQTCHVSGPRGGLKTSPIVANKCILLKVSINISGTIYWPNPAANEAQQLEWVGCSRHASFDADFHHQMATCQCVSSFNNRRLWQMSLGRTVIVAIVVLPPSLSLQFVRSFVRSCCLGKDEI